MSNPVDPALPAGPVSAEDEEFDLADDIVVEEGPSFSEMLDEFERHQSRPEAGEGGVLHGTVVSVREDGVFVDIGRKSEAFLPAVMAREGEEQAPHAIGDEIDVTITGRSPDGYLTLSQIIAERPRDWSQFQFAFENGSPIAGKVTEVIKGGLAVDVGVRAFLPASRSGTRDAEELAALVGQDIRCRITQLDVEDENVIVDRRVLLEEDQAQKRKELVAGMEPGQVVHGTVRSIQPYGAFVDLGGIDGLLHVSDLAWHRVTDVASVLNPGDSFDVKVLKVEEGGRRISVGLKQMQPDPWSTISERINVGDRVNGTVTRLAEFGAFVELEPGIEGLIHISEMSWARRVRHPKDLLTVGDVADVVVLEVQPGKRRIGLGLKQALGDPWEKAATEFPVGRTIEGKVSNIAKFGAFVEVADGIEGLIHISDITSEKRLNHPTEVLSLGQVVKAKILELDIDKRRLKLGIKQLEPDSMDDFIAEAKPGDPLTGRVVSVKGRKVVVEVGEGVKAVCQLPEAQEAAAPAAEPAKDVSSLGAMLNAAWKGGGGAGANKKDSGPKAGEVLSFKITKINAESREIELELA